MKHNFFGRALARARKKQGLSQERLSHLLEVNRPLVGLYEQGRKIPRPKTAVRFARVLGLDDWALLAPLYRDLGSSCTAVAVGLASFAASVSDDEWTLLRSDPERLRAAIEAHEARSLGVEE